MISQDEVIRRLQPVTDLLAEAIPKAVKVAKDSSAYSEFRPLSPIKLSTDFRYEMKLILEAQKYLVVEDCEVEFTPHNIGNIGLQFTFDSIQAKILKGSDGTLPVAMTDARVAFYSQPQTEFDFGDYTNPDSDIRVIYLWECNDIDAQPRAWLIRPKSAKLREKDVDVYWDMEIPLIHYISQRRPDKSEQTRGHRADLPIGLPVGEVHDGPVD